MPLIAAIRRLIFALHHRITAKILIAIVGGVGVIVFLHTHLMTGGEARRIENDFATVARIAATATHNVLAADGETPGASASSFRGLLVGMRNASGASRIALVGTDGVVAVSSEPGDVGADLLSGDVRESVVDVDGLLRAVAPLHDDSCAGRDSPELARIAAVVLDQGAERQQRLVHGSKRLLETFGLASMLGVTFLILLVVWVVVQRPISQIMRGVARIEQGDLHANLGTPVQDEFGRLAAAINSMLTSLREKNRELGTLHEARLIHADRVASMGQLASGFAHEIKNPLHGISSALTVIRSRTDPETVEIIDEMQHQIGRVAHIVNDMLRYARPRSSHFEMCKVEHVLGRTLMLLAADIKKHSIRVEKAVATDLPETLADQEKLRQVYLNLILNAIQATGDGGQIRVSLYWDRDRNLMVSDVEDDGPGIPEETAARIFEPFFTTKEDGHGLGLGTSRMLVEQNRGVLRLLPAAAGKGAHFQILLPVIAPVQPPCSSQDADADENGAGVDEYLFCLACGCPLGNEKDCPAEALRRIRVLDLTARAKAIRKLGPDERVRLRAAHVVCARRQQAAREAEDGSSPQVRSDGQTT